MSQIADLIRQIVGDQKIYGQVCKVSSVDAENLLIDAIPINDDAEIFDIRLVATPNQDLTTAVIIPKIDSLVIVGFLNENTGFVALTEISESIIIDIDGRQIELDESGLEYKYQNVSLKKVNDNLLDLIGDLIDTIKTLKVVTPTGTSTSLTPDSIVKINKAKIDLTTIKNDYKKLLK